MVEVYLVMLKEMVVGEVGIMMLKEMTKEGEEEDAVVMEVVMSVKKRKGG